MGTKKKVILFIVEGESDRRSLEAILDNYLTPLKVAFDIVHGDITTKFVPSEIKNQLNKTVQNFCLLNTDYYKIKDIKEIVHIVDMDGAYIDDNDIIFNPAKSEIIYKLDKILAKNPKDLKYIHKNKRMVLDLLSRLTEVTVTMINLGVEEIRPQAIKLPYRIYYFSRNLEHVLHNIISNLTKEQKKNLSNKFEEEYDGDVEKFLHFISQYAVSGNYSETWDFIKQNKNSLNRHCNIHLFFQ